MSDPTLEGRLARAQRDDAESRAHNAGQAAATYARECARLSDRLERAEGLLQSCKEPVWMVSELTTLSSPLRIDDSIVRRSERAKQLRGEIDAFLHGEGHD